MSCLDLRVFEPLLTTRVHEYQTIVAQINLVCPYRVSRVKAIHRVGLSQSECSGSSKRERGDCRSGTEIG